jgi:NAD(P)-dependent dehydrogenase (short-subunit alcohol dehydrogenase family)
MYPDQLFALQADVTKEESIQAAVDQVLEKAGALHGMVCNAGRTKHKPALDFTTEEIDQLWGVNLYGSFYSARCAARAFIKQGVKGSIVFTASMASYRPNKVSPPFLYCFSIHANPYPACTVGAIWRFQSRCPEYDTHTRHGVGTVQYPRQLRFTGSC